MKNTLIDFINDDLLSGQDETVDESTELLMEGIIDSLGVMRLVAFIESSFGVTIPPEDVTIDRFGSVALLADYLGSLPAIANGEGTAG
ncbi:MAG: acyl carrier protein [Pseudomonadota bacterium]